MVDGEAGYRTSPVAEASHPATSRAATIEAVKQDVLREVEIKVGEKVDALWQRGQQMMGQVQKKHQENADRLSVEIARCLEKQRLLEADNAQLKQVLASLATRLQALALALSGVAHAAPVASCCAASPGSATTATMQATTPPVSQTQRSGSDLFSPDSTAGSGTEAVAVAAAAAAAARPPPLPEIPAFPTFLAPPLPGPPTPLLLAEALGQRSPNPAAGPVMQPMPLSLADSLPPPQTAAPPYGVCATVPSLVFSFTLRKADQTDLGLNVSHHERDRVLCIEGVRAEGAVDAWNRQCLGGTFPEKAVLPGDRIVSVNSVTYDPEKMLEECKGKQLLRLTIFRGPPDAPLPDLSAPQADRSPSQPKQTSLRADASEFVPRGAGSAAATGSEEVESAPPALASGVGAGGGPGAAPA